MLKIWRLLRFVFLILFAIIFIKNFNTPTQSNRHNGSFKLQFGAANSEDQRLVKLIENRAKVIIDTLNDRIILPVDVPIVFTSDDLREGPAYSGNYFTGISAEGIRGRLIVYPYQMLRTIAKVIASTELETQDQDEAIADTAIFILVHEVVHALIDILALPILGPEEDAADCGATMLLASLEGGTKIMDHAILFWRTSSGVRKPRSDALADIHGLDLQRAYNLACWIYGQDIALNERFSENLPEHRAVRCAFEYFRLANSWNKVLVQNLKQK